METVDPTCVYSETTDTLNDIFMYRLFDRPLHTTSQASTSNSHESTSVIVFKCMNKESRLLVDAIRNVTGRTLRNPRRFIFKKEKISLFFIFHSFSSPRSEARNTIDRRIPDPSGIPFYDPQPPQHQQPISHDPPPMISMLNLINNIVLFLFITKIHLISAVVVLVVVNIQHVRLINIIQSCLQRIIINT